MSRSADEGLYPGAEHFLPARHSLAAMRAAVEACRGCPLYAHATHGVFGAGPAHARIVLVGEQPGNDEDLAARPFVGPAGRVLDDALQRAGIDRDATYVTNAVKHFKWGPRGTRRLHKKPNAREVAACHPWLSAELAAVRPEVLVCLGATASQALLGRAVRVTASRGRDLPSPLAPHVVVTVHPSSILRQRSSDERHAAMDAFVADLEVVATLVATR